MAAILDSVQKLLPSKLPEVAHLFSLRWWLQYFLKAYEEDPGHLLIEIGLFFLVLWLFFRSSYDPKKRELTEKEEEELIKEWKPEPLAPDLDEKEVAEDTLIVESATDAHVVANGKDYLNFASNNFLGLANNDEIKEVCRRTIEKYGVGSCGPRGFYGTIDVHLNLEKEIADFYGLGHAILYSDGIACIASVIPAFAKRGDLIICDECVHYGIKQGIQLSRSTVLHFKHNDMQDLERVLQGVREKDMHRTSKKLNRRFIVVEGIYQNYGDMCPLDKVYDLMRDYKYRLILDDSLALGVVGKTGRGTPEYFNIPMTDVDALCASLDCATAAVGGFCVGLPQVVNHQRLSGLGYCFSASSPPYSSMAALTALQIVQREPERVQAIQQKAARLRKGLKKIEGVKFSGPEFSPVVHLHLKKSQGSREADEVFLRIVEEKMRANAIVVTVPRYIPGEEMRPEPSLRISVTVSHSDKDIDQLCKHLAEAFQFSFSL